MSLRGALNHAQGAAPFDGFVICDVEEGPESYFGYQSLTGAWIIKRYTEATGAMRYSAGADGYSDAWSTRASLSFTLPADA